VYEAKGRPLGKPVSVAVSDTDMLCAIACADDFAYLANGDTHGR
jgi:L-threonylcarbamoyladenylate synthase